MKKLLLSILLVLGVLILLNSCGDDDEVEPCNCPASSPWSKPDINDCYSSKAACESAEGGTCQICN